MSDELVCLVRRAQRGDAQAFDALVRGFQDRAVAYARSVLPFDRSAAEDAVQEAFVQAWRALPTLAAPQAFPVWLRRVVFKYCDRVRRRSSPHVVSLDAAGGVIGGTEPFAALKARGETERLREAFYALPPREREAALLYYWGERDQTEIADALGVPRTTVKNRLYAARQRLRKELWEMAEEILAREKPSRNDDFVQGVVSRAVREFQQQMKDNPHTADRGLLTEGRAALDAAMAALEPLAWETVRDGLSLLLDQDDPSSVPTLMMRYLAQPIDDSRRFWAYFHLINDKKAVSIDDATNTVLAYEALERLLSGRADKIRLSGDWPFNPVSDSDRQSTDIAGESMLRLASLASSYLADAFFLAERGDEYLDKVDAALQAAIPSDTNRQWRFYCLRMAVSRCEMHRKIDRARGYIEQLYALSDEPENLADRTNWRLKAIGHEVWVLRATGKNDVAFERCLEALGLLEQFPDKSWSGSERHNLAHTFMFTGRPDLALPLYERNHARGKGMSWGFLFHAAALYHVTGDRARTLMLLRDAAVREASDMTEQFQKLAEFADVKDDAEFLAAIRRPDL